MRKARITDAKLSSVDNMPVFSVEAREQECISLAIDRAKQQLIDGTASSQVITHFLKLATAKEQVELENKRLENELIRAKTEALESQKRTEEKYELAMKAFKSYAGLEDEYEDCYEDEDY